MSIELSIVILFAPLACCFFCCWLVDDLLDEFLATNKQLVVAGILVLLNVLHLIVEGPFVYSRQWGFFTLLPGFGLMLMVLPGMGDLLTIKEKPLPLLVWSIMGGVLLVAPLIVWWLTI